MARGRYKQIRPQQPGTNGLRAIRLSLRLSETDVMLASNACVSVRNLEKLEKGITPNPRISTMVALARVYNLRVDEVIDAFLRPA